MICRLRSKRGETDDEFLIDRQLSFEIDFALLMFDTTFFNGIERTL